MFYTLKYWDGIVTNSFWSFLDRFFDDAPTQLVIPIFSYQSPYCVYLASRSASL